MAKKKTQPQQTEFVPSRYQAAIFDHIEHGHGNLLIEACAGAGKTTTIVEALKLIPSDKSVLFAAFNKDIVNELSKRTKEYKNVETTTLHSLGFSIIKANYRGLNVQFDPYKYDSYMRENLESISKVNMDSMRWKDRMKYQDNIRKYLEFGRFYLCQTPKDLDFIEERYGIETLADEKEVAIHFMEWGKLNIEYVDYTDMIWLPNVLFLQPYGHQYDFIMVDEVQDLDRSKRELLLKCTKINTRICAVGDSSQCIYSFSGSDPESFNEFKKIPNTKVFPLSISYRCARNIVNYAKVLVPTIECNNDGRIGEIREKVLLEDVKDGDMILCRNNAPLIQLYCSFLKLGKKCRMLGKEIGSNLTRVVKSYKSDFLNADLSTDGLFVRLYDDLFSARDKLMSHNSIDERMAMDSSIIQGKLDVIMALETLSEGINTKDELLARIDEIFPKKTKKEGIILSTIHKAKGLEADNVYIACRYLMPSRSAKKPWEKEQERNLMYVAYTRARNVLGFIDDKDMKKYDTSSSDSVDALANIEARVNAVLGKEKAHVHNLSMAKSIISMAKPVTMPVKQSRTVSITGQGRPMHIFEKPKQLKYRRKNG